MSRIVTILLGLMLALSALAAPAWAVLPSIPAEEPEAASPAVVETAPIENTRQDGTDDRIAERIRGIFSELPRLQAIAVEVSEGVVTLSGSVADPEDIARAENIASRVSGVVTVENGIRRDLSVEQGLGLGPLADKWEQFVTMLPLIGMAVVLAAVIGAFGYLIASLTGIWHRIAPNSFLAELIASAIRFIFVVGGIVIALDMIGAGALMGAVLGGAGVIGIALGFAMRDTIENYVASLMLSLRQPFRANDWVVIDSHEGRVIRLTSRATILMTLDGNHLRIPNSAVFKAVILNYTRNPQRRFEFDLGVDADDDPMAAREQGRDALAALPFVLSDPAPEARIMDVGDSNIVIRFLGWIDQRDADWYKARTGGIAAVKKALEEAGFAIPEPIYRLRFDQRTVPLPLENIAEKAAEQPEPSSRPASVSVEEEAEDVAPQNDIAEMVDKEREQGEEQAKDLLDPQRPVE